MKRIIIATLAAFTSTMAHGQDTETYRPTVPLMLPASDSFLQSFVRLINRTDHAGEVDIIAVDDGGTVYDTVTVQLAAGQNFHFNSGDLTDGNANKGIDGGIGAPMQGNWRLTIETNLEVEVLSYTRARDGFLTATHELLPRNGEYYDFFGDEGEPGYSVKIFNPASNTTQQSRLRLINWGAEDETVRIEGVDDGGNGAGPVSLTLPAGHSRTLTAIDLEQGAHGLEGTLGDGVGKWRLNILADVFSIAAQSLIYASSGHISNLSAEGFLRVVVPLADDHGDTFATATDLATNGQLTGDFTHYSLKGVVDVDVFKITPTESGYWTIYTTGEVNTLYDLYDVDLNYVESRSSNADDPELNRIERLYLEPGTYFVRLRQFITDDDAASYTAASYTIHAEFEAGADHGDTFATATDLIPNQGWTRLSDISPDGDKDYFRITLDESGTLTVELAGSCSDCRLSMLDSDGQFLRGHISSTDEWERDGLAAGTYFALVQASRREYGQQYLIRAEFEPD